MDEGKKSMFPNSQQCVVYDSEGGTRTILVPALKGFKLPSRESLQIIHPKVPEIIYNPGIIPEACGTKVIIGGVMGAVMGVGLGIFMGAMADTSPIQIVHGKEVPQMPLREAMRGAFKATASKSIGWAKSFGVLSALFGGIECVIEKHRAKHDVWNPVLSGCAVGATLSASGGPQAACLGCVGFAGFSLVVDKIMGPH